MTTERIWLNAWPDLDPTARQALIDEQLADGWRPDSAYSVYSSRIPVLVRDAVRSEGDPLGLGSPMGGTELRIDVTKGRPGVPWSYFAVAACAGAALAFLTGK